MATMIEVSIPGGMSASWKAMNERSAIRQAKLEADRGALVKVETDGKIVFSNHPKDTGATNA
jgi:hypothetical protein